jgi:signal transduction histidine kinase
VIRKRLYLQIYLAFLAIALSAVVGTGLLVRTLVLDDADVVPVPGLMEGLLRGAEFEDLPGPELDAAGQAQGVEAMASRMGLQVALFDANGAQIAASTGAQFPDPAKSPGTHPNWVHHDSPHPFGFLRIPLEDGRVLALREPNSVIHAHHRDAHPYFLLTLGSLLLLAAIGCYPLARRITWRLEAFQADVVAFGGGELDRRVEIRGDDELARLAEQFNLSAERIGELVEGQQRVLALASHELRSPIARVRLALELLAEDSNRDSANSPLAEAVTSLHELDELVGEILLASRMQSGAAEPLELDLGQLVRYEAEHAGGVTLDIQADPAPLRGDPVALRRLLRNLLENAGRHGQGQEIRCELNASATGYTLVVADRGPGIPESERSRVFEPFYRRAGHSEGKDGGVGLGLALVQQVAEAHGGSVRCEARDGGGSSFVVTLPRDAPMKNDTTS